MSDTKYSVKSGFYDSVNRDRLYSADDMNQPYKAVLTEGVLVDADDNGFVVAAQGTPNMTVLVRPGHALLGGKWVDSDHDQTLTVPANSSIYGRIDSIVLQVNTNTNTRAANLIYRTGTPAGTPAAPDLNNGSPGFYEVRIANIAVAAGATAISTSNITDQRGTSDCPLVELNVGAAQIVASLMQIIEEHPELITAVPDGGITTAKLAAKSVTTAKIADEAVTTAKIADKAVTRAKLDDDLTAELDNKANIDGYYDRMTVGQAEQVLSNVKETERSPYIFRASGGSLEIGNREQDTLVGMDLVWNQLVQNGNFADTSNWTTSYASFSVSNNEGIITPNNSNAFNGIYQNIDHVANHKVLVGIKWKSSLANSQGTVYSGTSQVVGINPRIYQTFASANTYYTNYAVCNISNSGSLAFRVGSLEPQSEPYTITVKDVMLIDLTAMFGSTIADYIYSLETGTAGAGVAWVKRYLTKDYYPYSAPTMQNGVASSHDMVGFNQYDNANPTINVFGGTQYQITGTYTALSLDGTTITPDANGKFTPSKNGTLTVTGGNSTNTCVHFAYDGERDGEYEPYVKHSYPLDDTVDLHGIPMKDESGNLYADGDTYEADGTVTRRYHKIDDISLLSFNKNSDISGGSQYYVSLPSGFNAKGVASTGEIIFESSDNYTPSINAYNSQGVNYIFVSGSYIWITSDKTTVDEVKADFVGKSVVYLLATPTTESAEPFQTPQIVDNWGTEEYVTSGNVPIGHTTDYPINIKAKVEAAPDAPEADGIYLMQRLNGVNTYTLFVPELPTLPSEDGNYLLGLSVSGSGTTKTLSWEVQS